MVAKKLSEAQKQQLIRDLAVADSSQVELGRKYGVSKSVVTKFKQDNRQQIESFMQDYLASITGENIKQQDWRIMQYERDLAKLEGKWSPEYVRVRTQILKQVAEEQGQLPPRMQIAIMPVTHIVRGIDLDEALPIDSQYPLRSAVSHSQPLSITSGTTMTPDNPEVLEVELVDECAEAEA
jgi:hypothetical protein